MSQTLKGLDTSQEEFKTIVNEKEKYEQMKENIRNAKSKAWGKNGVEVIVFNGKKWLNETNIRNQLKHSNLAVVTLQYSLKYRKQRQELQNCGNYQP